MPGRKALHSLCFRPGDIKRDRRGSFCSRRAHHAQHAFERRLGVELASTRAQRLSVSLGQRLQHRADDLDALDRIDAEVGLEALVEADHVARIAGLLLDDREQHVGQLVAADRAAGLLLALAEPFARPAAAAPMPVAEPFAPPGTCTPFAPFAPLTPFAACAPFAPLRCLGRARAIAAMRRGRRRSAVGCDHRLRRGGPGGDRRRARLGGDRRRGRDRVGVARRGSACALRGRGRARARPAASPVM